MEVGRFHCISDFKSIFPISIHSSQQKAQLKHLSAEIQKEYSDFIKFYSDKFDRESTQQVIDSSEYWFKR